MTAQKNNEVVSTQEPVESHTNHSQINILDTLAANTRVSYENDLSLFGYWLLGYKPANYRNEFEPEKEYPLIPVDSMNHVVHLSMNEVADLLSRLNVTPKTISTWLQDVGFYYKLSTIRRKISAINWMFNALLMDVPSAYPQVKQTFKALTKLQNQYKGGKVNAKDILAKNFNPPPELRTPNTFKKKQSNPFRLEHLQTVMGFLTYGNHTLGENRVARDKAMISLAWHGLFRRSEVASIKIDNLEFRPSGLLVHLYDTKNHEEEVRAINYANNTMLCPVRCVEDWLKLRGTDDGYLFAPISKTDNIHHQASGLSGRDVMRILQSSCELAGLKESFSGHSPRSGGATEIYLKTKDGLRVQKAGNWKSDVWKDYVRTSDEERFDSSGMAGIT